MRLPGPLDATNNSRERRVLGVMLANAFQKGIMMLARTVFRYNSGLSTFSESPLYLIDQTFSFALVVIGSVKGRTVYPLFCQVRHIVQRVQPLARIDTPRVKRVGPC